MQYARHTKQTLADIANNMNGGRAWEGARLARLNIMEFLSSASKTPISYVILSAGIEVAERRKNHILERGYCKRNHLFYAKTINWEPHCLDSHSQITKLPVKITKTISSTLYTISCFSRNFSEAKLHDIRIMTVYTWEIIRSEMKLKASLKYFKCAFMCFEKPL